MSDLQKKFENYSKKKKSPKQDLKDDLSNFAKTHNSLDDKINKVDEHIEKSETKKSFFKKFLPKPKKENNPDRQFESLGIKALKKERKIKNKISRRNLLRKYLKKAGYENIRQDKVVKSIFNIAILACLLFSLGALIYASINKAGALKPAVYLAGVWTGIFGVILVVAFLGLFVFLDLKIFKRTMAVEAVLPDYLQLVSANISAGMTIDRALWFAVRPKFGVLAKEIEEVAKATIAGEPLDDALIKFTEKYDSLTLKRSVSLLLEGIEAGGEMADLISKIAINIQELRIMKKEMAANVTTYVIFISFATIAAAPFLFALSTQLLVIIQSIIGSLDSNATSSVSSLSFSFSENSVALGDFKIFAYMVLTITSTFSAAIISVIRFGNIKEGVKYIPIFIVVTLLLYWGSFEVLSMFTSGFF